MAKAKKAANRVHTISKAGKEAIAAAQRKRWKKYRAEQAKKKKGGRAQK